MSFSTEVIDNGVVVSYKGDSDKLDSMLSPALKSTLVVANSEGHTSAIVDLSAFRYCDSSGLSAILVGNRLSKNAGGSFILCGVEPMVMKLIQISQLDSILTIVPTLQEAKDYLTMETVEHDVNSED